MHENLNIQSSVHEFDYFRLTQNKNCNLDPSSQLFVWSKLSPIRD